MMDKDSLLLTIAETGYNVGFGAKKTFATFDIVTKAPGWIGFISFAIGTFALFVDSFSAKVPSALLLIAGVASLYISVYNAAEYEKTGTKLTRIHNKIRDLYRSVKDGLDIKVAQSTLKDLEDEYYSSTLSKQIFLSDWYAHFKFFSQAQSGWMDEQLHFSLWKDMIPLSAKIFVLTMMLALLAIYLPHIFSLLKTW